MNSDDNRPIRVLCVFGALNRGGAECMCMNLFRNIDRNQVVFDFVKHTETAGDFEEEIKSLGGKIYTCIPLTIPNYSAYVRWWDGHFENHPEHKVVHGHMFTTSGIYFKEAHKYGRITIGHSHCANATNVNHRNLLERAVRKALRNQIPKYSDYRYACSHEAGELIFPKQSFTILQNAIDTSLYAFDPAVRSGVRHEFSVPEGKRMIIVIGRLTPPKNPHGIISICNELCKMSDKWHLLWCGSGEMDEEVKTLIKQNGLEKYVTLAGVRRDIPRLLQGADVYLMPSIFEGLPVAAVEAQAAGIPCILSDTISPDIKITNLCHFLPLGNWHEWANEILSVELLREDTRQQLIDAGYDIKSTASQMQQFYIDIAHKTETV